MEEENIQAAHWQRSKKVNQRVDNMAYTLQSRDRVSRHCHEGIRGIALITSSETLAHKQI